MKKQQVISGPFGSTLAVMVRDVGKFRLMYEEKVLSHLKTLGFTSFFNEPIEVYHGPDCVYSQLE